MQKIVPFLWFDGKAEEAANFYTAIFNDARITDVMRSGEGGPGAKGSILSATFELAGQKFIALNGGPMFQFTPAISFFVYCETQAEVDDFWVKLSEGGQIRQCGWLTDKFGVTWQIVPIVLMQMLVDKDAAKAKRVMTAMMKMVKFDIALLTQAYEGG
jgi:predicted 3-demethylubiquinone-9 3-methyltransferase (glyoxalase superfamily)